MKKLVLGIVAAMAFCLCGCTSSGAKTLSAVLDAAYQYGGSATVAARIDKMVADGKLTPEQASQLKAGAQKSYDSMQSKLIEMQLQDTVVETEETK